VKRTYAYTMVEMMIVTLIIAVILSIAIPNFIRSRESSHTQICVANLKQMDAAKEQWAMDNRAEVGTTITGDLPTLIPNYIKDTLECPSGGSYTLGLTGAYPTCSKGSPHIITP
jgi:prepilin-type N-terminal cleavage/methylation domain-containing protein